jgi:hypothetical protein
MTGGQWQSSLGLRLSGKSLGSGNIAYNRANPTRAISQVLGFGNGSGTMNQLILMERSLGPGLSETLDLYDGSTNNPAFIDILGSNVAFRTLRGIAFWILDGGDTAGVTIGNAASNAHPLWWGGTTPTQTIYPSSGGMSGGQQAGVAVTSSVRNVKVLNNGAVSVTYIVAAAGAINVGGGAMGVLGLTYP